MPRYSLLLLAVLGGVFVPQVPAAVPDSIEIPSPPGTVLFSHTSHAGISCQQCHHTSSGARVEAGCRTCHTKTSSRPRSSRQAFHDSCIGCHAEQKKAGQQTGPVKLCSQCHHR